MNAPKNLVRQKNIQLLIASDKPNVEKPHTPVPFDLHAYMNQLTTNSNNTTNENLARIFYWWPIWVASFQ